MTHNRTVPLSWLAGCLFGSVMLLYLLPSLAELYFPGPSRPLITILVGDLLGCAVLALLRGWKAALFLYLLLSAGEWTVWHLQLIGPVALIWIQNVVPSLAVAAVVYQRLLFKLKEEPEDPEELA